MVNNSIIFTFKEGKEHVEVMKLVEGKFFWHGEEIEDKYEIYERFNDWLKDKEKGK